MYVASVVFKCQVHLGSVLKEGRRKIFTDHMTFYYKVAVLRWKRFVLDGGRESSVIGH
jgi:hypothetical protein